MTMDVKCSAVYSVKVNLTFDDGCRKERIISVGDIIDCVFNSNGLRRHITGKVLNIHVEGSDPKSWLLIVDGSSDFEQMTYRFSPMNILDVDIIKKIEATQYIESTNDYTNIKGLRVVSHRLQYTQDGVNWHPFVIDSRDIIKDEEGTASGSGCHCNMDDEIRDEIQ